MYLIKHVRAIQRIPLIVVVVDYVIVVKERKNTIILVNFFPRTYARIIISQIRVKQ
jgi:hypothetical protein